MSAVECRESEGPVSDETLLALGGAAQQIFHAAAQSEWTPVDPSVPGLRPWRTGRLQGRPNVHVLEALVLEHADLAMDQQGWGGAPAMRLRRDSRGLELEFQ